MRSSTSVHYTERKLKEERKKKNRVCLGMRLHLLQILYKHIHSKQLTSYSRHAVTRNIYNFILLCLAIMNHQSLCSVLLSATVVPHVTDAIQDWVERVAEIPVVGDERKPDICVIEVRESCKLTPVLASLCGPLRCNI